MQLENSGPSPPSRQHPQLRRLPSVLQIQMAGFVNWEQFDKFLKHVEAQAEELQAKGY